MRIRRAFIFVPETPMIEASVRVGKDDFKHLKRGAGSGVRKYIAVHEFIHACGLDDEEHSFEGPNGDVFIGVPNASAGNFDKPNDDKIILRDAHPIHVSAPPSFILSQRVADLIKNNWA